MRRRGRTLREGAEADAAERVVQSDRQNHIDFEEKTVEVFGHWDCQPD